jgi:ubiquinone biosynthesis protein UbiJ
MTRYLYLAIVFAALAAASAPPVLAEYRGTPEQQKACRPNVFRYCAEEIPNVRKITACLRRNIERLTPDCQAIFRAAEQQPQQH